MPRFETTARPAESVPERTTLGIELGSTRIKACLVDADAPSLVVATGSHAWENALADGVWTYALDDVWHGIRAAVGDLAAGLGSAWPGAARTVDTLGVSAMMHGYLAFAEDGELLVPFRTWRNTSTRRAAEELSEALGVNIPLRWSIAHLHQAVLNAEEHVARIGWLTTLAGYVHERLTGLRVLGVGDASGMFPVDAATATWDADRASRYDEPAGGRLPGTSVVDLLPRVLVAGAPAGALTDEGAALLDPTGELRPGIAFCPPEGDAGTGMVATDAVAPRLGNVSAGTSIFAMVVLERPLAHSHPEIDVVATPDGRPVAMVHCNNGASELDAWAGVFARFAAAAGHPVDADTTFQTLFREALEGETDAGGVLAYNQLAGEPIAGLSGGRPMLVRTPDSRLSLPNIMRAQVYGVFATLALGMRTLHDEGVEIDRLHAHGGLFRTPGAPQRFLAAALDAAVSVSPTTAGEGGAWGMAVLAAYARRVRHSTGAPITLDAYLARDVFAGADTVTVHPDPVDAVGFAAYLERYRAGLAAESAAVAAF